MTHTHSHHHSALSRSFFIALSANGVFVILQVIFAYFSNSTSLLADAAHNFGDVLSLLFAYVAHRLTTRAATARSTYGMKKTSILAALTNGALLIFSCGIIVTQALYKFYSPTSIETSLVMIIALLGILVNGSTALLFTHNQHDLNVRAAFLHLFFDALISLGVFLAAIVIHWTTWLWVDPLMGLVIALIILKGTWSLFADSFRLIIDGVPRSISWTQVRESLLAIPGVQGVHDLHIWALSTQENALSVHLWMPIQPLTDATRQQLTQLLREQHSIHHVTIQIEQDPLFCNDLCTPSL